MCKRLAEPVGWLPVFLGALLRARTAIRLRPAARNGYKSHVGSRIAVQTMTNRASFGTVIRSCSAGLTAAVLLVGVASAQSLGDVARQEGSRRKAVSGGKVYTNQSLPATEPAAPAAVPATPGAAAGSPAPAGQTSPAPGAPASSSAGQTPAANKAEDAKKDEAYWRKRLQTARDARSRAESFSEALQSRINALSNDFVNRDDPAQRNVIASDRQKALAELDRVKKEIQQYTKDVADTQEEARRAGVPAGWVR
jgi:hypothetical protein